MIFKTASLYDIYHVYMSKSYFTFTIFSCTLVAWNVYKHVYILPLYTDFSIFFFWFSETKQVSVVRQNHVDFFNWKVQRQTFHYICDCMKIFEGWKVIFQVFYLSIKAKKKSVMIFYFLALSKYFVNLSNNKQF